MRIRLMCLAMGVVVSVMSAPTADAGGFFKKLFGCCKEEPTCCEPEPACCPEPEPEPVCCEPEPEPVMCCPEPEPEPVCCPEPEPVMCCEPEPAPEPCCASTMSGVSDIASTAGLPAGAVIVSTRVVSSEEIAAKSASQATQLVSAVR